MEPGKHGYPGGVRERRGAADPFLEALRKAVDSKAAVCSQLLALRDAPTQGAAHQEASAAADPFDVFD